MEMISSAVVVPTAESSTNGITNGSISPSLKRKLSDSRHEERKRPRVDTDTLNYDDKPKSSEPSTQPETPNSSNGSPMNRRASSAIDEKKRNKRLFGSLLGTLSQSNNRATSAHKKRDEIEARQRERLRKENEDQEAERRRRKDELVQRRKRQQKNWEEGSQRIRHESMRATAGFLKTKTQPTLYYMPWELRDEEEERIKQQKEAVEMEIQQELGVGNGVANPVRVNGNSDMQEPDAVKPADRDDDQKPELQPIDDTGQVKWQGETDDASNVEANGQNGDVPTLSDTNTEDVVEQQSRREDPQKDDDHHGEELVQGQEDDVIY